MIEGWQTSKLGDLFEVQLGKMLNAKAKLGKQYNYLANYNVRWGSFNLSDLNTMHFNDREKEKFTLNKGDLIMCEGGEIGRCAVWQGGTTEVFYQKALHRIKPLNEGHSDTLYLQYYMRYLSLTKKLIRWVGETSIAHLTKEKLVSLPINHPPLPEQKAIADVLSTWDQAIENTQQLIKAKEKKLKHLYRVLLQIPIIEKKWNTKQLGDLFVQVSDKVGNKDLVPHSISAGRGFISQKEKWGKDISGKQYQHYTHLKAGQISYNKGNSKRYKQGCAYLLMSGEVCVPSVFISFKPSSSDVNVEFFEHYFAANYHSRELKKFISSGARSDGLLNLNKKDFFKIKVPHPNVEQQDEVSECLTGAGKEIELLNKLLTQYQTQKRGLMQRLLTGEWRVNLEKQKQQ